MVIAVLLLFSFNSQVEITELVEMKYVWLLYFPVILFSVSGLLISPESKLERVEQRGFYKVIFQITTRGLNKEAVKRTVESVLYWAPIYLKDFRVWVVSEEGENLCFLKDYEGVEVIYVPGSYRTKNLTKYKSRALNYSMELRKSLRLNNKATWVYFMDEESVVGEDTILGIIDFIENESKKGKLIGQGLIVYGKVFGWLKGKLYEQSPFTIRDLLKQRRRWFWAAIDLIRTPGVPAYVKAVNAYLLISWLSSLISQGVTYFNLVFPTPIPSPFLILPLSLSLITMLYLYWIGCELNLGGRCLKLKAMNLLFLPIIGVLEGASSWYGLITYINSKRIGFEVINKDYISGKISDNGR